MKVIHGQKRSTRSGARKIKVSLIEVEKHGTSTALRAIAIQIVNEEFV
jgi:hypothetical protein